MTTLSYHLGVASASEEFVRAVEAGSPDGAFNAAHEWSRGCVEQSGAVYRPPSKGPLQSLWEGELRRAYRESDTNLAIVLEAAFSDAELGLEVSPSNNPHDYQIA